MMNTTLENLLQQSSQFLERSILISNTWNFVTDILQTLANGKVKSPVNKSFPYKKDNVMVLPNMNGSISVMDESGIMYQKSLSLSPSSVDLARNLGLSILDQSVLLKLTLLCEYDESDVATFWFDNKVLLRKYGVVIPENILQELADKLGQSLEADNFDFSEDEYLGKFVLHWPFYPVNPIIVGSLKLPVIDYNALMQGTQSPVETTKSSIINSLVQSVAENKSSEVIETVYSTVQTPSQVQSNPQSPAQTVATQELTQPTQSAQTPVQPPTQILTQYNQSVQPPAQSTTQSNQSTQSPTQSNQSGQTLTQPIQSAQPPIKPPVQSLIQPDQSPLQPPTQSAQPPNKPPSDSTIESNQSAQSTIQSTQGLTQPTQSAQPPAQSRIQPPGQSPVQPTHQLQNLAQATETPLQPPTHQFQNLAQATETPVQPTHQFQNLTQPTQSAQTPVQPVSIKTQSAQNSPSQQLQILPSQTAQPKAVMVPLEQVLQMMANKQILGTSVNPQFQPFTKPPNTVISFHGIDGNIYASVVRYDQTTGQMYPPV